MLHKRVAVIGAGLCGLACVKSLKDEGLEPVCFERTSQIGGLWRYHDDDVDGVASVMKTTIINTSKELGAFSNCPPPAECPNYMHHTLMLDYIKSVAIEGDCVRHVRFNHETVKIEKTKDYEETGRWTVTCRNTKTDELVSEVFDCVAVCIGHHVYPNEPTFPGQEKFKGKVLHTHSLKKVDGYDDMRVAVIGVGNSGMDAAVELSSVAKKVYLCSRQGVWVLPRVGPKGHPFDSTFTRRICFFFLHNMPYNVVCYISENYINRGFNHDMYSLTPKHRIWSQHPTVSDTLPIKLLSGVVVIRGGVKTFTEKGIIFEEEEAETELDAVILATGYHAKFPFLGEDVIRVVNNKVQLYKFIFPPHLPKATLAILGLVQPSGPGIPVVEMQCRWASRIFNGLLKLPSAKIMHADIRQKMEFNQKRFVDSPRHTFQVDFIAYQDELAEGIGCKPNFWKLAFTDPKLLYAIVTGPSLPYQYRLKGPHSWDGAREAVLTYKERTYFPLQKPGQTYARRKKTFNITLIITLLLIILVFGYLFLNIMKR